MNVRDGERLLHEKRKVRVRSLTALVFCIVVIGCGYTIIPRYFAFPTTLPNRIAFCLRADLFVMVWVLIGVAMVARARALSSESIQGAGSIAPNRDVAIKSAILQNTLEQVVIAVGAHLALATLLSGSDLVLIVLAVALFGMGRIAFVLGYPYGAGARAFGMATTAMPSVAGYALGTGLIVARLMTP